MEEPSTHYLPLSPPLKPISLNPTANLRQRYIPDPFLLHNPYWKKNMSLKFLSKTLNRNQNAIISSRYYYTNRSKKVTLYSKISPLGDPKTSLLPELDNWVQNGNKVRVGELQRIIRDFRKRKRFSQALEVSEWMNEKEICIFSPVEHAVQLDLIGKVRGFLSAENYFNNLMDHDKNDKTYGALLNCYVRQRQTEKSISHLQKMKEMGYASSPLAYNDIMCLYTNLGQYEKVPHVLAEMKEHKVAPDNFSFRICINSYGARFDIEGMERVLNEMECRLGNTMDWNTYAVVANFYTKAGLADKAIDALKKSEDKLDNRDEIGYNHLISIYASLGIRDEILRLWDLEKSVCKRRINRDFVTMLESLVKLGDFEEAEEVLKEWESSGNCYDVRIPNILVVGYSKNGLYEKAEMLLKELMEKGKATTPNSWATVASGYLEKGEMAKAFECMKAAFSTYAANKGWKPNQEVVMDILNWLGSEGTAEDVEAFVALLSTAVPMDRQIYIYHPLLKAKIRSDDRMETDKISEDEETKRILA